MSSPGRNDPCPCGSGRKYKHCCLGSDEAMTAALASTATRESSIAKLLAFAFQPEFDTEHSKAEVVFWGTALGDASPDDLKWLLESEDSIIKYNSWFLFDWELESGVTVADLFLENPPAAVTTAERRFLERLCAAHLRLYEVEEVDRGHGMALVDLWTGARVFVIEKTASAQMVTWDLIGARVAPDDLGGYVFEGALYLYPADMKDSILRRFRRLYRRHHRRVPDDGVDRFFKQHGMVFHHLWLELVALSKPPKVVTAEGDRLMFCRSVFDTEHAEQVRTAIAAHPDVQRTADGLFSWREAAEEGEREVGTWTVEDKRLILETTSQERAARGQAWIERLAGGLVRYRATAIETPEQALKELRRNTSRRPPAAAWPEADSGAVRELFDRHYQSWLDRPLSALGNRTPRAAAQTKLWRPRVIELLKQAENDAERASLAGRPSYDFRWIWTELGLERLR